MKPFGGPVLFLDRNDINTDEIIPAKYLTENSKEALKPYLLEDLKLEGFDPRRDINGKGAILTRGNFGCGSSREHAPWALEVNGINLVIGESFARIFRQNMYNCGLIAVELPPAVLEELFRDFAGKETALSVDIPSMAGPLEASQEAAAPGAAAPAEAAQGIFKFSRPGKTRQVPFILRDFERALVEAGGWVEYAAARY
jgi:3-isopropylmalate/(R)-2-methylmalate dehydratase small subunit